MLDRARRELAQYYPTYADFEPLDKNVKSYERQPMQFVPLTEDGTADIEALNAEFGEDYLAVKANPRWVAKPTVAYLWARTVRCKNCRATIPLLKTRWLCKKSNKRVLLTMEPNSEKTGVVFGVEENVPVKGGNVAQRREHDKRISGGTMSRAGAKCPCCSTVMTMEDLRVEGQSTGLGVQMTVVITNGQITKEYRQPTENELSIANVEWQDVDLHFSRIPFGLPMEPTPAGGGSGAGRAFSVQKYGLMRWSDLFTLRQLLSLATVVHAVRSAPVEMQLHHYRQRLKSTE